MNENPNPMENLNNNSDMNNNVVNNAIPVSSGASNGESEAPVAQPVPAQPVLPVTPTNNVNDVSNGNLAPEKSKKKTNIVPIIIVVLVLVLALGAGYYFFIHKGSNQNIYYKLIDSMQSALAENVSIFSNVENTENRLTGDASFSISEVDSTYQNIANILNKLRLNLDIKNDLNNKILKTNVKATYNSDKILDIDANVYDKDLYLSLGDLYSKPILVNDADMSALWGVNHSGDYKVIINELGNIIKESLSSKYFSNTKVDVTVNGKNIKATNYKLLLTGKDYSDILNSIYTKMASNENLLNAMSNVSGVTIEDLKENINTSKDALLEEYPENLEVNTYVRSNIVEKVEIKNNDNVLVLERIDNNTYNILDKDEKVGTIQIENNYIRLTVEVAGTYVELEYNMGSSRSYIIKLTFKESSTSSGEVSLEINKEESELRINLSAKGLVGENSNVAFKINLREEKGTKLEKENVSNSVEMDKLTDKDYEEMSTKLMQSEGLLSLVQDILVIGDTFEGLGSLGL